MQGAEEQLKEFLLDSGLLSRTEVSAAERRAQERSEPLHRALVESGLLGEEETRRALAYASGVSYVTLSRDNIDVSALLLVPEPLCRAHNAVAFSAGEAGIEVALLDLSDLPALDFLKHHGRILPRLTSRESLRRALLAYQKHLKDRFDGEFSSADASRSLEALIAHALLQGASAIHFEYAPDAQTRVRYRIRGALHEALAFSPEKAGRVLSRLKDLAGLEPSAAMLHEARIRLAVPEPLSVRISFMPTVSGEKAVLNLSPEREGRKGFTLETLGFHGEGLELLQRMLHAKRGLLAVLGTPRSGVTTTLYTLLDVLDHPQRALASVEREVEYRLSRVSQTQVDEAAGFSAAAALRAALRQDPDVLMVADAEESVLALAEQAAQRCLVIVGADEAADLPFADVVVRQRLVRRLCDSCKKEYAPSAAKRRVLEERADFARVLAALKEEGVAGRQAAWKDVAFWSAEGCEQCEGGYLPAHAGRTGRGLVGLQEVSMRGETPLNIVEDGLFKAAQGLTDLEEVVRVASEMGK